MPVTSQNWVAIHRSRTFKRERLMADRVIFAAPQGKDAAINEARANFFGVIDVVPGEDPARILDAWNEGHPDVPVTMTLSFLMFGFPNHLHEDLEAIARRSFSAAFADEDCDLRMSGLDIRIGADPQTPPSASERVAAELFALDTCDELDEMVGRMDPETIAALSAALTRREANT